MIVCLHSTFIQELCETGRRALENGEACRYSAHRTYTPRSGTGGRRDPHSPGIMEFVPPVELYCSRRGRESLKTAQVILGHSDLEQHYWNPAPDRCARTSGREGSLELRISSVHGQKYLCLRARLRRFFAPEILCIAALSRFHGRTPRRTRCHRQPCVIACL